MAILTSDSLLNCLFIPDFIPPGSKMIFENPSSPTSWTRDTTPNDATLRVINGSISSNLTNQLFSTVFSNRSISYTVSPNPSGTVTISNSPVNTTLAPITPPSYSVGPAPYRSGVHQHTYIATAVAPRNVTPSLAPGISVVLFAGATGPAGGGGLHTHSISLAGNTHSHTLSSGDHNHPITDSAHNHPSSSFSQDFRINYKDFILATKD